MNTAIGDQAGKPCFANAQGARRLALIQGVHFRMASRAARAPVAWIKSYPANGGNLEFYSLSHVTLPRGTRDIIRLALARRRRVIRIGVERVLLISNPVGESNEILAKFSEIAPKSAAIL
jgi:hypothetical protein